MFNTKDSDLWQTPIDLFNELDYEFHFHYDVCQNGENGLKPFLGDYFTSNYHNCICFMNPPFSNSYPFIERALALRIKNVKTVCLLKLDTSTKLFGLLYNYQDHNYNPGIEVRFFPKRIRYTHKTKKLTNPTFPSMLVIINPLEE